MTVDGDGPFQPEAAVPDGSRASQQPPDAAAGAALAGGFSLRVLVYFLTQVITAALGLFNGFLLARLIGPDGRGDFYLLTFYPTMLMILGQLGLPQAFTFFTARRRFDGLISRAVVFSIVIGSVLFLATIVLLPELQQTLLKGLEPLAILAGLVALPFMLNANFTTGIVVGRQSAYGMALIYVGVNALTTVMILVLVGALDLGVWGALIGFVVSAVVLAGAFLVLSLRVTREVASEGAVDTRRLFAYGLPFLPVSLSQFFAARTDVLLLAALLTDPSAPIGYYSLAVGIAELVFLFPNAVSTFFFPHVAGASREDSDSQVAVVSRLTLLLTGLFALALAPAATIAILVVIPAFAPALPSFYILLAAATATGPARVLVGYLAGLSRPGLSSTVSLSALVANVALGLLAIPSLGIIGAALAVLVSSVFSSVICAAIAVRLSGEPFAAFWVPRLADVRYVIRSGRTVADRVRGRGTPT